MLLCVADVRRQSSLLGTGWASGIAVLVFVLVVTRLWYLRGTWRPDTQTTRAFVELWHRRVAARLRLLKISIYISIVWIVFCAALTAANWSTIGKDIRVHPNDWVEVLVACIVMQPVIWIWAQWLRRRKLSELANAKRILDELKN